MSRPYTDAIVAANSWLTAQGLNGITIVTTCFGGWSWLMAAPMLPNLEELRLWIRQSGETNVDLGATNVSWRWWAKKILKLTVAKLLNAKHRIRYRKVL